MFENQGEIAFDSDRDGELDASAYTDDPGSPELDDPTRFTAPPRPDAPVAIPALSPAGLAALALLLAAAALRRMRRRRRKP